MTTLSDIGEHAIIQRLVQHLPGQDRLKMGPGDDCAVVDAGAMDLLFTSDPVIENVHFKSDTEPRAVGHKAIGRVLSDIAAMGGQPRWALMDIAAPDNTPVSFIEEAYAGAAILAERFDLTIAGGDVARGPVMELHVFAVGEVPRNKALLRSGAQPGDALFVTGSLGGSSAGRHLAFTPRIEEGRWLRDWATAMIDISDGLATDLQHVVKRSGVGACIDLVKIPVAPAAEQIDSRPGIEHALGDGEDFELLFTVPAERRLEFESAWTTTFDLPCTAIGSMTTTGGACECVGSDGTRSAPAGGYQHFASASGENDE